MAYAAVLMTGVIFIDINLLDAPNDDAKVIESLAADSAITVEQRQGSWTKVATLENTGWVPTLTIRIKSITKQADLKAAAGEMKEKFNGDDKTEVVATMGIRGIDEENLKQAKFNKKQLALLESYHTNEQQLIAFSQAGNLRPKKLAYFDEKLNINDVEVIELSE